MPANPTAGRALYRLDSDPVPVADRQRIALLGATGSIGEQTLDLVQRHPEQFRIVAVAIHSRWQKLVAALSTYLEHCPDHELPLVAIADHEARESLAAIPGYRDRLLTAGDQGLIEAVELAEVDCVVNGLVGAVGLAPTLAAVHGGKRIALANKESLVVGGELVHDALRNSDAWILPVDSEHSAIAQCLAGRTLPEMERIVLTASGGPFHGRPEIPLEKVTRAEVLRHPTWNMGPKITVDSATLMNKGLEVIEAYHLFGLPYDQIEVVIHPGSVVHSLVVFRDGAVMAQLGAPDMRVPLLYAMSGEKHWPLATERLNLIEVGTLRFEKPDTERFPCLRLARMAGETGGIAPVVLNAANEVAVAALLQERLQFGEIPVVIEKSLNAVPNRRPASLADVLAADEEARRITETFLT
ncbi:MAG: 1-deoxy-D-xylulose-5-phosphate reductoisomerase [bacterium]